MRPKGESMIDHIVRAGLAVIFTVFLTWMVLTQTAGVTLNGLL